MRALLLLPLLLAFALPAGAEGPAADGGAPDAGPARPRVVSVQLRAPPGTDVAELSELAGIHAGDALSVGAVRDAVERLYATERFADVVARAEAREGGVGLAFELAAQQKLVKLEVEGLSSVERAQVQRWSLAALERASGTRASQLPVRWYPEQLELVRQAVAEGMTDLGFAQADVQAQTEERGRDEVVVLLRIREGAPTRLTGLVATGDPGSDAASLLAATGLVIGQRIGQSAIDGAQQKLRTWLRAEGRRLAVVGTPRLERPEPARAVLVFPVEAGPQVQFRVHGSEHFEERVLLLQLGERAEVPPDEEERLRMARRLRDFLQRSGFADARVTPGEQWGPGRQRLVLTFEVDERLPVSAQPVRFLGNAHFGDDFLRERVEESLRELAPPPESYGSTPLGERVAGTPSSAPLASPAPYAPDPATVVSEKAYAEALQRISELYRADGYLSTAIDGPRIEFDEERRTARATFTVTEGVQTRIDEVDVTGVAPAMRAQLLEKVALKPGAVFSPFDIEASRRAVVRELQRQGHLFARVEDQESFSLDQRRAQVRLRVDAGPQVRVRGVIVQGAENTREVVIRSALDLGPKDVFDGERVAESQRNLNRLGVFSRITLGPLDPDRVDAEKDLLIQVEERPRSDIAGSIGGSLVDGPRVGIEASRANILGLALEGTSKAKVAYNNLSFPVLSSSGGPNQLAPEPGLLGFGGVVNLGLRAPRLFFLQPAQVTGHVDLVGERVKRPAYSFTRGAGIAGLDWTIARWLTVSLNGAVEGISVQKRSGLEEIITNLSQTQLKQLRFEEGRTLLASVTPSAVLDLRDDAASPRSGLLISTQAELAHDFGGDFTVFYVKPQISASVYVPLPARIVLALSGRGGRVFSLRSDSTTIPPKRFFLGGASTLRGYPEDGLTPEDRRPVLKSQVESCQALATPLGCTSAARVLGQGISLPSEGGQAFVLYKAELRFPITGDFQGAVFVDAGDLWLDPAQIKFTLQALRVTPGFGLRYATPVGPVALDVGFNPRADETLNETTASARSIHFSIGLF